MVCGNIIPCSPVFQLFSGTQFLKIPINYSYCGHYHGTLGFMEWKRRLESGFKIH